MQAVPQLLLIYRMGLCQVTFGETKLTDLIEVSWQRVNVRGKGKSHL